MILTPSSDNASTSGQHSVQVSVPPFSLKVDHEAQAAYITLMPGVPITRTVQLSPGVLIDVSAHGTPVGVELLNWPGDL